VPFPLKIGKKWDSEYLLLSHFQVPSIQRTEGLSKVQTRLSHRSFRSPRWIGATASFFKIGKCYLSEKIIWIVPIWKVMVSWQNVKFPLHFI